MKVALVHDWLTGMRGGERVLEELCTLFPGATIFTLFHKPGSVSRRIESMDIRSSFLNRIPGALRNYRSMLPLFPLAISGFDLHGFDLVFSVSHAAAKGIRKPPGGLHICYCLTPMRYIWDLQKDYFQYADPIRIKRTAMHVMTHPLRMWDRAAACGVDHFIADSWHVQRRISRYYDRESDVIYPPVDTEFFTGSRNGKHAEYYLVVSALVPYKRVDVAIRAFNRLGHPLIVAGAGPDLARLRRMAAPNIDFRGFVTDHALRDLYRNCRAVIITAREDFGLVSLEAQACGRPALAYAAGGALESIVDGNTGILYGSQTADSLIEGVKKFERMRFSSEVLRYNAERFSRETFHKKIHEYVSGAMAAHRIERPVSGGVGPSEALDFAGVGGQHHPSLRGTAGIAKRGIDILLSLCGLLVLGLPLLLLAALIRRDSAGPAFFFQTRVGLRRRNFVMIKLRTMYTDAERHRGPTWATKHDSRCTRLGGFLRRYGIDELPQLWNVLMGDMSLIGPRPERPEFQKAFEAILPGFGRRVAVRGGISGLAQIRGWRGDTSLEERLKSDLEYVEHWSLWVDLLILCRTPFSLLRSREQMECMSRMALS